MVSIKLITLQILNILTIKAIINKSSMTTGNYKTLQAGTFYLNSERPLWILQDQKNEQVQVKNTINEKARCENVEAINYYKRQQQQLPANNLKSHYILGNFKTEAEKRVSNKGVRLPHNYIRLPFKKTTTPNVLTSSRRYQNSKFIQNLPVFDAVPGDESLNKSRPIFVYTGNKGRMLLNTMLSTYKYPMQEPVPGQVLYPPQTLVFKPKPLVEKLQRKFNVSMIPFYPYEAIDPRNQNQPEKATSATSISIFKPVRKAKKVKQYSAFFSPEAVLSQPSTDLLHYDDDNDHIRVEHTTNPSHTLEKPYANHRFDNRASLTTTPLPHKKFEVTYNGGEDKFQITYEDDAAHVERPLRAPATKSPLPYESYTFDNNHYAFPVYTMAKLMENDDDNAQRLEQNSTNLDVSVERQGIEKYIDAALKEENDSLLDKSQEDTWFILNSKYKGPLRTNTNNLHSSKYVQTSPAKLQDDTKKVSLYGENIEIV